MALLGREEKMREREPVVSVNEKFSLPPPSLFPLLLALLLTLRSRMGTHGQFQKPCSASAALSS